MTSLVTLAIASIAFVATHFILSHPLRAPIVVAVGEKGFMGVYSLVALATFVWMVIAFRAAPAPDLGGSGDVGWAVASVLTVIALVLFLGSFRGNPAMPAPDAKDAAGKDPRGAFLVTRHPMMWGFALWAIAHLVLFWSLRTTIVALAILTLALVGAKLQDGKKERLMGAAWTGWEAKTTYWPRWSRLFSVGWGLWLGAIVIWLLATYGHIHAAGAPAGIWMWVG
tara:strand:+ start:262 stop:936 length:675 start_codon:yes stop_codon:yes gene_type:complete